MNIVAPWFKVNSRRYFTRTALPQLYYKWWELKHRWKRHHISALLPTCAHLLTRCTPFSASLHISLSRKGCHVLCFCLRRRWKNAQNLQQKITQSLTTYGIEEGKVHVFVPTAESSVVKLANLLLVLSCDCIAHKLQPVIVYYSNFEVSQTFIWTFI